MGILNYIEESSSYSYSLSLSLIPLPQSQQKPIQLLNIPFRNKRRG